MVPIKPVKFVALALIAAAVLGFRAAQGDPAQAAEQAAATGAHSAVRLLAGAPLQTAGHERIFRAGVELTIDPGWKTYWRYPGDSGVPPRFDFAGSDNVADVTVLWPAPQLFADGAGGHSIGYSGELVLPLHITPREQDKPVRLHLDLDYAVCERICIPARATLQLDMTGANTASDDKISASEARAPRRAALGDKDRFAIHGVAQKIESGRKIVLVDVGAPAGAPLVLLAEGPNSDWALPIPTEMAEAPPGYRRFSFELAGAPPGASTKGIDIRLTAIAGTEAIEATARLD